MKQTETLGTEPIGRLLLLFALPSVISQVMNAVYNLVDQIFIGQGVGYLANGATNVIFPLTQLAMALGMLIGDGTAGFLNLKLGAGDRRAAERGMAAGIVGLCLTGCLLAAVYGLFLAPLCRLFGATEATFGYAMDYGRIIALGIPFYVFASGTASMVRADGSPRIAMGGMLAGCAINFIGDPLTIFVFGLGVKGAALATITGQVVNALINAVYLTRCRSVELKRSSLRGSLRFLPRVSRMGLASFATQLCVVLVIAVQNNLLVYYGAQSRFGAEIPMTALGVTMKVFTVLQCAIVGLTSGAQPIVSYNYGSGRTQRVRETLKWLLALAMGLMAAATVWFQLAPMSVVRIFGSADPLYNEFSVLCLRVFLVFLVLDSVQMVASSFFQSLGKAGVAAMLVTFRQVIVSIPAQLLLAYVFGVKGVLYSGPVAGLCVGAVSIVLLLREWRRLGEGIEAVPYCRPVC